MHYGKKIVLHCPRGLHGLIDSFVAAFIKCGVIYVGVVGKDASQIEDIIDWSCIGEGDADPYFMLTASHEGESLENAIEFAEQLTGDYAGPVQVVEF
jgi:hypothetical protein